MRWALRNAIDKFECERNDDAGCKREMSSASRRAARLFLRLTGPPAAAVLIGGFGLAATAAAQVLAEPAAVSPYTLSPGRMRALLAIVVGLIGVVNGWLAFSRSAGRISHGDGRRRAALALVLGAIGLVIGVVVVATAEGGLGTGHGFGGGIVAMTAGLIGIAFGWLAQARSRHSR